MKIIQFVLTTEYTELHGVRTRSGLYDKTNSVTPLKTPCEPVVRRDLKVKVKVRRKGTDFFISLLLTPSAFCKWLKH